MSVPFDKYGGAEPFPDGCVVLSQDHKLESTMTIAHHRSIISRDNHISTGVPRKRYKNPGKNRYGVLRWRQTLTSDTIGTISILRWHIPSIRKACTDNLHHPRPVEQTVSISTAPCSVFVWSSLATSNTASHRVATKFLEKGWVGERYKMPWPHISWFPVLGNYFFRCLFCKFNNQAHNSRFYRNPLTLLKNSLRICCTGDFDSCRLFKINGFFVVQNTHYILCSFLFSSQWIDS